ncbi:PaaX family transcriptional regulator C-terminal domain-containing protein [Paenibacillus sabinae]|uniref:PaaX family transcriptional regulator n=1 Tax=Paenibacillus sabinae T27 TaxID=1268072 RepID=X4ZJC5_9BACL|nr:PaaX family transcriptional regulator C-terminal domain-containing protein [Paenibacillus sabinae]AHV97412.1 PaaX family transcriptional regulator [Paenibacillus sabinae T27]
MLSLEKQILYMLLHRRAISTSEFIRIFKGRGKSEQVIRNTLSSLKKKGYIVAEDRKYNLAEAGARVIESLQLKFSGMDTLWDERWHFVMFSIPEQHRSMRNSFRRELMQIGYGLLFDGVFVCPFNRENAVLELAAQFGLDESWIRTAIGELRHGPITAIDAERIWPVQTLNEKYAWFIGWINDKIKESSAFIENSAELMPWDVLLLILEAGEAFGEILLEDPFLPKELLPDDWKMPKARELYHFYIGHKLAPLLQSDKELYSLIVSTD